MSQALQTFKVKIQVLFVFFFLLKFKNVAFILLHTVTWIICICKCELPILQKKTSNMGHNFYSCPILSCNIVVTLAVLWTIFSCGTARISKYKLELISCSVYYHNQYNNKYYLNFSCTLFVNICIELHMKIFTLYLLFLKCLQYIFVSTFFLWKNTD